MDRSNSASNRAAGMSAQFKLVQQELRFYFVGQTKREVIFSVVAESLDDAWQQFCASGRSASEAFVIIKTQTEIYLA
jgi:hypothetical protein